MINLRKLSKIGIGTYRMSSNNKEHEEALRFSFDNGVNLIDTASNYEFGKSEELIGNNINDFGREKVFLISKAGYIQENDLKKNSRLINERNSIKINTNFHYSINKEFLKAQIEQSLKRLNTDYLDGFLIHNPEHYFDVPNDLEKDFYSHLVDSLNFLEDLVKQGVIRYYGISSNKAAFPNSKNSVNLMKLFQLQAYFPNFKILQFPFNLVEQKASTDIFGNNSLFSFCKEKNIIALTNRPLNTTYQNKVLRLADYSNEILLLDEEMEERLFKELLILIKNKLIQHEENTPPEEFVPIKFFIENKKRIANPEAVDKAINNYLMPFLLQIELKDSKAITLVNELRNFWVLYSKKYITDRTKELKRNLTKNGMISNNDNRDISTIACEHCLKQGADHVLVGMRKKKYVKKILDLNEKK